MKTCVLQNTALGITFDPQPLTQLSRKNFGWQNFFIVFSLLKNANDCSSEHIIIKHATI